MNISEQIRQHLNVLMEIEQGRRNFLGKMLGGAAAVAAGSAIPGAAKAFVSDPEHKKGFFGGDKLKYTADRGGYEHEINISKSSLDNPGPTIILAHNCVGAGTAFLSQWGSIIKKWGYNVVTPDSFSTRGAGGGVCNNASKGLAIKSLRADDLEATARWITKQPWHSGGIGIIGWSHGGPGVIQVAYRGSKFIQAAVAYYPTNTGIKGIDEYELMSKPPKIPLQIHQGEDDDYTPPDFVRGMKELPGHEEASKNYHMYPGTHHSFDNANNAGGQVNTHMGPRTVMLNLESAALAEKRTKEWFDRYVSRGSAGQQAQASVQNQRVAQEQRLYR